MDASIDIVGRVVPETNTLFMVPSQAAPAAFTIVGQTAALLPFYWTSSAGVVILSTLGGNGSANACSADGSIIVGSAISGGFFHAVYWIKQTGTIVDLGTGSGTSAVARRCSSDGSVIVGEIDSTNWFRWTQATGIVSLGSLGSNSFAYGCSADGSVIVGYSQPAGQLVKAARWTQATGVVSIDTQTGDQSSQGFASNSDGAVEIGDFATGGGAFRWTQAGGMVDLGILSGGTFANAFGCSDNGNIIVGQADDSLGDAHAAKWTQAGGWVDLDGTAGQTSDAVDCNGDGTIIIGSYTSGGTNHAMYWTQATGMIGILTNADGIGCSRTGSL